MAGSARSLQGTETKLMYEMINAMERVNSQGDPPEMDGFVIPNYGYVTDRMGGVYVPPTGYSTIYEYKGKYFRYCYDDSTLQYVSVSGSVSVIKYKSMTLNEWLKDPLQNIKDYVKQLDIKTMSSNQHTEEPRVATFSMRSSRKSMNISTGNYDRFNLLNIVSSIWSKYFDTDVTEDSLLEFNKIYKNDVITSLSEIADNAEEIYQKYYSTLTISEISNLIKD